MSAPITHAVLADRIQARMLPQFDRRQFIAGALFPDIRWISGVARERTHVKDVGIKDVQDAPNAFFAGFLFHSLCDITRENFAVQHELYRDQPSRFIDRISKFYEDELRYPDITEWDSVVDCFGQVLPEELTFQVDRAAVSLWHRMQQEYFRHKPTASYRLRYLANTVPAFVAQDINAGVEKMRQDLRANKILDEFNQRFEELIGV